MTHKCIIESVVKLFADIFAGAVIGQINKHIYGKAKETMILNLRKNFNSTHQHLACNFLIISGGG